MTDCQEFDGHRNAKGYGRLYVGGVRVMAHRLAWALANGADPGHQQVMHRCDNPSCVNPEHLTVGSNSDNVRDKVQKGRQHRPKGVVNPAAKLDAETVMRIRRLRTNGKSLAEVAREVGVAKPTVWKVDTGRSWNHV